jgi:serine/threonine-protein kinase
LIRASATVVESGLLIGGRYRLQEPLGRGGMSVVWRADDEVLGRDVAVKMLTPRLAEDPDLLRRIRDEARAAASLRHPHVVEVYDYGVQGRVPYVVMEALEGRPMADLLTGGALPWRLAVLIGAQVAAALSAAHARGIVHRDVKPANVMVTASGVKIVDFGISAAVGEWESPSDQVLGTPAYLAPERIGGGPARPATDVYALGLLLYLAFAGRLPWTASTTTQMLKAHVYAEPAPLPAVPGLPRQITRLVHRCLAKTPGDRPTAAEVADRLGEIAGLAPNHLLRTAAVTPSATTVPVAVTTVLTPVPSAKAAALSGPARAWWDGLRAALPAALAWPSDKRTAPPAAQRDGRIADLPTVSPVGQLNAEPQPAVHHTPGRRPGGKDLARPRGTGTTGEGAELPWWGGGLAALSPADRAWWVRDAGSGAPAARRPRVLVASLAAAVIATSGLAWATTGSGDRPPAVEAAGTTGEPGTGDAAPPSTGTATSSQPAAANGSSGNGRSAANTPAGCRPAAHPAPGAQPPAAPACHQGASAADAAKTPVSVVKAAADRAAADRAAANRAVANKAAAVKAAGKKAEKRAAEQRKAERKAAKERAKDAEKSDDDDDEDD